MNNLLQEAHEMLYGLCLDHCKCPELAENAVWWVCDQLRQEKRASFVNSLLEEANKRLFNLCRDKCGGLVAEQGVRWVYEKILQKCPKPPQDRDAFVFTTQEAALFLGVTERYVRDLIEDGFLKAYKAGRYLISWRSLEEERRRRYDWSIWPTRPRGTWVTP